MGVKPHDLIRLTSPNALKTIDPPEWVAASIAEAPWVVVRRSGCAGGGMAVGVRGRARSERFAAFVEPDGVAEIMRPEDLRDRAPARNHPAFDAIDRLRPALDGCGCPWGPAGAAGYELATGRAALTADSDLDLILRLDRQPERAALAELAAAAATSPIRVDILLETPRGAVAFDEFLGASPELLLRTSEGPRLARRADLWIARC